MAPSYLTRSSLAWIGIALIVGGFILKFLATALEWPIWLVPLGYFVALAGAAFLFVGWVRWKISDGAGRSN